MSCKKSPAKSTSSRLGWLSGRTVTLDSPGIYSISLVSPNHPSKGAVMGQIRLKDASGNFTGQSLYLEFRRQLPPFDVFPSVALAHRGLSIRLASENLSDGSNTNLFDLKPSTISGEDGMLLSGNSFTSSYYGVSISTLSVSPMFGARVKVELSR